MPVYQALLLICTGYNHKNKTYANETHRDDNTEFSFGKTAC